MVSSLLTAIVRADGDALVMHVGEQPYVVAAAGPVELSSRPLTLEAVAGMLGQLLPAESRRALDELGAIEHELPKAPEGDRFSVVAARGGDDIWIEIRRHRALPPLPKGAPEPPPAVEAVPVETPALAVEAPAPAVEAPAPVVEVPAPPVEAPAPIIEAPITEVPPVPIEAIAPRAEVEPVPEAAGPPVATPEAVAPIPSEAEVEPVPEAAVPPVATPEAVAPIPPEVEVEIPLSEIEPPPVSPIAAAPELLAPVAPVVPPEPVAPTVALEPVAPVAAPEPVALVAAPEPVAPPEPEPASRPEIAAEAEVPAPPPIEVQVTEPAVVPEPVIVFEPAAPPRPAAVPEPVVMAPPVTIPLAPPPAPVVEPLPVYADHAQAPREPVSPAMEPTDQIERALERLAAATERPAAFERPLPPPVEPSPAVVLPLSRSGARPEVPPRAAQPPRIAGVDRLLRLASARGANTLYLLSQAKPSIRADGEIAPLEGEPTLSAAEVESLLLDLAPERNREALRNGEGTEWMSDVPEVGRVRCQSFRDHRGPGGVFRMIAARPTTAEQLGLSREIQALAAEPEGLILVAGPRSSGKSTLLSAFVDLINRARSDYVVTIETQIACVHDSRGCLVSQREVRGDIDETAAALRAALRENPDVIVIEDLRSPEVVRLALDAVDSGHLVIGAVAAHTSTMAIGRILEQFPPDRRVQAQAMLAEGLRGVVSQVLLQKAGGGRVAARELLLNTPPIAGLIAEGRLAQLPVALDSGRKHGMVPLNDALAAFVQSGIVDVKDAYRKAYERQAFLAVLRREGVDTSFVERLA